MNYFHRRRIRKVARELLYHAKHLRNMREDLMQESELRKLSEVEWGVRNALKAGDANSIEKAGDDLYSCISKFTPRRLYPAFRENFEIIVVAIVVAMAFRTYFIQPFKIPTGSMQPTLYGIHSEAATVRSFMDRMPMKVVKWLVYGEWYTEVRAKATGHLIDTPGTRRKTPSCCVIAGELHKIPRNAKLNFANNDYVSKGAVLWSGIVTSGDHVFVDKIRWNFRSPRRAQIMVFSTDNIPIGPDIPLGTHYIKRLVGLPRETIAIQAPRLIVNGQALLEPEPIRRIATRENGYRGFATARGARVLGKPTDSVTLTDHQYFVLGDNSANSKDGRYWGTVPQENAVGPAFLVYWPFSWRWGFVE